MEIHGKVHCFFEQSGTFKNEFIKLGIPAEDYDIQNNFGETDHVVDLFAEIDKAYQGEPSIYDSIAPDDMIFAFFPCIYFCAMSQLLFTYSPGQNNYRGKNIKERTDLILQRDSNRSLFLQKLIKMFCIAKTRGLRMVVENPWTQPTYLKENFILPLTFIDQNRMLRGDFFEKPTAYWFVECEPTHGFTLQNDKRQLIIKESQKGRKKGICSEVRSMISPDYARNFICDFIIGKKQPDIDPQLF